VGYESLSCAGRSLVKRDAPQLPKQFSFLTSLAQSGLAEGLAGWGTPEDTEILDGTLPVGSSYTVAKERGEIRKWAALVGQSFKTL
jgi:hypothetical protein